MSWDNQKNYNNNGTSFYASDRQILEQPEHFNVSLEDRFKALCRTVVEIRANSGYGNSSYQINDIMNGVQQQGYRIEEMKNSVSSIQSNLWNIEPLRQDIQGLVETLSGRQNQEVTNIVLDIMKLASSAKLEDLKRVIEVLQGK